MDEEDFEFKLECNPFVFYLVVCWVFAALIIGSVEIVKSIWSFFS